MFSFLAEFILNCHTKSPSHQVKASCCTQSRKTNRCLSYAAARITGKKRTDGSRVSKNQHNNKAVLRSVQQSQGMNWDNLELVFGGQKIPGTYNFSKELQ